MEIVILEDGDEYDEEGHLLKFCVYKDGDRVQCFASRKEAQEEAERQRNPIPGM